MNYGFKIGVIDVFEQTSLSKSTFYDDETGKHLFKEIHTCSIEPVIIVQKYISTNLRQRYCPTYYRQML